MRQNKFAYPQVGAFNQRERAPVPSRSQLASHINEDKGFWFKKKKKKKKHPDLGNSIVKIRSVLGHCSDAVMNFHISVTNKDLEIHDGVLEMALWCLITVLLPTVFLNNYSVYLFQLDVTFSISFKTV